MPLFRRYCPRQVWHGGCQVTVLVHFYGSAFLLYKQGHNHGWSSGWEHPHHIQAPSHYTWAWASWLTSSRSSSRGSDSSTGYLPSTSVFLARHPPGRYSLIGTCPFADLAIPSKGKWDHSPSDLPDHLHTMRTHVTSPEVEIESEHSSTQGNDHIPDLTPETRTSSRWQGQESFSPSSSPTRGPADPDDEAVAGSSKSTEDWTSSDSGLSKGNMTDSDLDTAFWRLPLLLWYWWCIHVQTAWKKYRKRSKSIL